MKKWHMEGIVNSTMNTRKKLVFCDRNQMYLSAEVYSFQPQKRPSFAGVFRFFSERIVRRNV
jgi:hypothetical protein